MKDNPHKMHRSRLRTRAKEEGIFGFQPHEMLELILFPLIPYKDTNPLAHSLIDTYGSLEGVLTAPEHELASFPNMTAVAAQNLNILGSLPAYLERNKQKERKYLRTEADTFRFLRAYLSGSTREVCYQVSLDINYKLIAVDLVNTGSHSAVAVEISKIVENARKRGAANVILAHSHPSGGLKPSEEDILLTEKAAIALGICEIHLVDHYIITNDGYTNFTSKYMLPDGTNFIEFCLSRNSQLFSASFIKEDTHLKSLLIPKGFEKFSRRDSDE